jgi:hypothetical protein
VSEPLGARLVRRLRLGAPVFLLALGCDSKPQPEGSPPLGNAPSPNASILPAPLAPPGEIVGEKGTARGGPPVGLPADSAGRLIVREPEPPPPEPLHVNTPLERDTLDTKSAATGLSLKAIWRLFDLPAPPPAPEVSAKGIEAAAEAVEPSMSIDLAHAGRMRIGIDAPVFPLPPLAELRARTDTYGHALVWPNGLGYRLLAPGSLRTLFAERRPDVTPLVRSKPKAEGNGRLHGVPTTLSRLETEIGSVVLEQGIFSGSGPAGPLLCRFLVELIAVDPATDACKDDAVPLAARFQWARGGRAHFEVREVTHRQDLAPAAVLVPPPAASFQPGEMPPDAAGVFLNLEQLAAFRVRPAAAEAPPPPGAPGEGIIAVNHTRALRYLVVDGVLVAWVRPRSERYIIGPKAGRYSVGWRDFLGTQVEPPTLLDLPARVEIGNEEAETIPR